MKKSLAAFALAGSVVLIGAVPAVADHKAGHEKPYPAPRANSAVSDGTVGPGEQFVFRGQGFKAGEPLSITVTPGARPASNGASIAGGSRTVSGKITLPLESQSFTASADSNGEFAVPITLGEAGTYTITATGLESGITATSTVTVEGAITGSGVDLANNGNTTNNGSGTSNNGAPLANTGGGTANSGVALANTGADTNLVLWSLVGAGALAAGVTSVVVVRRRAKADATA